VSFEVIQLCTCHSSGKAGALDHRTEDTPDGSVRDSAPRGQEVPLNFKHLGAEKPVAAESELCRGLLFLMPMPWSARVPRTRSMSPLHPPASPAPQKRTLFRQS
jgi:hypothetical protein